MLDKTKKYWKQKDKDQKCSVNIKILTQENENIFLLLNEEILSIIAKAMRKQCPDMVS